MFVSLYFIVFTSLSSLSSIINNLEVGAVNLRGEDNTPSIWDEFTGFQEKFSKKYDSIEQLEVRFEIFKTNLRTIISHNSDVRQNFTMGINKFSDLTNDEFKQMYAHSVRSVDKADTYGSYGCKSFTSSANNAPDSIDWRVNNAVTSVKDQGQCGSCWTFSSTVASEGAWAISTGELIDLSEQQLVDCAKGIKYGSHGCNGGQMEGADKYLIEHGQCSNTNYPYVSGATQKEGTCVNCLPVATFSSCSDVKPNDQISLKGAVFQQPVSVALSADSKYFQFYSSGVLTSNECYTELNHGVAIVGYGEENGQKYWNVKNSWGVNWGEKGYIRILRSDSTNDAGICGIAMDPSFISV
jgi:C1A family cysteine protease